VRRTSYEAHYALFSSVLGQNIKLLCRIELIWIAVFLWLLELLHSVMQQYSPSTSI